MCERYGEDWGGLNAGKGQQTLSSAFDECLRSGLMMKLIEKAVAVSGRADSAKRSRAGLQVVSSHILATDVDDDDGAHYHQRWCLEGELLRGTLFTRLC